MAFDVREYTKRKRQGMTTQDAQAPSSGGFDVREYTKQKRAQSAVQELGNRVNAWVEIANSFANDYNSRFSSREEGKYVSDSQHWLAQSTSRKAALDAEAQSIRDMIGKYSDYLDSGWVSNVGSILQSGSGDIDKLLQYSQQDADFWAQFNPTQEQAAQGLTADSLYGQWYTDNSYRQKYAGQSYSQLLLTLAQMEDGEEKTWLDSYSLTQATEDELRNQRDTSQTEDDYWKYQSALNQKQISNAAEILSKSKMAGTAGSILDEVLAVSQMEDSKEKRQRKNAAINAMKQAGVDPDTYYSLITGDKNVTAGNLFDMLGSAFASGFTGFGASVAGLLDKVLGVPARAIGWDNGLGTLYKNMKHDQQAYQYNTELYKNRMGGGTGLDIAKDVVSGTAGALPQALLALVTGGTSTGVTLTENAAMQTGGILAKAGLATSKMLQNPAYWMSFAQTYANDYDEARAMGADDLTATFGATISSLINAGLEIGIDGASGIQGLPKDIAEGGNKAIFAWAKSTLEEGGEEVMQEFVNNAVAKVLYDSETKLVDPAQMVKEFGLGTAVGGILGGGQVALQAGVNAAVTAGQNAQTKNIYGGSQQELVAEGLESPEGSQSNALAQEFQKQLHGGKNLSGKQLRQLIEANEQQFQTEAFTQTQQKIQTRLTELGETGDVETISRAIAKQANGQLLTVQEQAALRSSQQARQVASETESGKAVTAPMAAEKISRQQDVDATPKQALAATTAVPENANRGKAHLAADPDKAVTVKEIAELKNGSAKLLLDDGTVVDAGDVEFDNEGEALLYDTIAQMGIPRVSTANVLADGIHLSKAQDMEDYAAGIEEAFRFGQQNVPKQELRSSTYASLLDPGRQDFAYRQGQKMAGKQIARTQAVATGKTGRKKGVVRGEGVTIGDLRKTFNDTQGKAYKYLSTVAEVTGIDIVLYRSKAGPDGKFQGAQGRYRSSEPGTIYIDLNAGLSNIKSVDDLAKYAMLRTFAHEFTHFIEKWNPIQYSEFRMVVFDTLTKRGENVRDLIETKQAQHPSMSHDKASREVVAEAMTDILPDANFVQELAQKHKNIFTKLLEKLKEFVSNLRDYFDSIGHNPSREASALKKQVGGTVKYLDSIVQLFDQVAVQAVENYQQTSVVEEVTASETNDTTVLVDDIVQEQSRAYLSEDTYDTNGVHWGIEAGVMTKAEARKIWEAIANIGKRGYSYPRTTSGEHIVSADNALFFVNADYRYPSVNKIIRFNEEYKVNCGYAKELIIDARGNPPRHREAMRDVADLYGEGFAVEYDRAVYAADARKNGPGEGKNRGTSDSGIGEQNQQRTDTLTDREVLAMVANEVQMVELTDAEKNALSTYKKRFAELENLQKRRLDQQKKLEKQEKEKISRSEILKTKNRIATLNGAINRESQKLAEIEKYRLLQQIRNKALPVIEARILMEQKARLAEYRKQYGTIPTGEKAVRSDSLPKSTDGTNKVSRTARTVKGAGVTPDDFADLIDAEVAEGGLTYLPITNNDTTQKAISKITEEGWDAARYKWHADVRAGKVDAEMSAMGALLLNNAAKAGDRKAWLEILADYQIMGTRAAQAVQALRILKTLSPSDKLYMLRKSVQKMVKDLNLESDVVIDDVLIDEYNAAETDEQRDAIITKIQKEVALQLPTTGMEMWTALRYVNMLGNFKTQIRNVLGNVTMAGVNKLKNTVAAALEALVSKVSGGQIKRTKSIAVNHELLQACRKDFEEVESLALDGGKYSDVMISRLEKGIRDQKTVFKAPVSVENQKVRKAIELALKPMEAYRKATNSAMEKGDLLFSRGAYARALAGYLKAHGVTSADLSKVDTDLLDEARAYAIKEAQEVTFRDHNALTELLCSGKIGDGKLKAAVSAAGRGIMPFRQTPANVLLRAEEYSPLGLINSLALTLEAAAGKTKLVKRKGLFGDIARAGQQVTGDQIINSFAKTFTGFGLFGLGMVFANLGFAVGGPDDDENKAEFDELNGRQNYALVFGDTSWTFDWLAPAAIPFFMGVNLQEKVTKEGWSADAIRGSLMSLTEPMLRMSMLQGLNDTLDELRYSNNSLLELGANALTDYALQGMTNSLLAQLERSFESNRQATYTDKNKRISTDTQYTLGKISAKIPGWDYSQVPYINAWGEEEENLPLFANIPYSLFSPSYYSQNTTDAVAKELYRLDKMQDENVFPSTPGKTFKYENEEQLLTAKEYVELAKTQGQMQRKLVEKLIVSAKYKALSDTDKAKTIQFAYKYAKEYAQIEVLGREDFSAKWMREIGTDVAAAIIQHVKDQ